MIFWYTAVKSVSLPVVHGVGGNSVLVWHWVFFSIISAYDRQKCNVSLFFSHSRDMEYNLLSRSEMEGWKDGVSRFCFQWQTDTHPSPFLKYHLGSRFMLLEGSYLFPSLLFLPHRASSLFSCLTQSWTVAQGWVQFSTDSTSLSISQPQGYDQEQKGSRCISWYKWMIERMCIS